MKKALITRTTGLDCSYLAEFLLEKGYEVHQAYPFEAFFSHYESVGYNRIHGYLS